MDLVAMPLRAARSRGVQGDQGALMAKPEESKEKEKDDSLVQKLLETRNIVLSQEINDELAHRVIQQLLLLETIDPAKDIRIFINSPGGSADGGFAIFDTIRYIKAPVKTIAAGLVASAASIILLGPKKEHRFGFPHCRILLHQPSTHLQGSAADIEITAHEILKLREKANQLIAAETGQTVDKVASDTNRDYGRHLKDLEEKHGFRVVGGDTVRKKQESFLPSPCWAGSRANPCCAAGPSPGHRIYLSGRLGGSAAGLSLLTQGVRPDDPRWQPLFQAHLRPEPPLGLGPALSSLPDRGAAAQGAEAPGAAIDVSDGLSSELWHLSVRSGCRMVVEWGKLPYDAGLAALPRDTDGGTGFCMAARSTSSFLPGSFPLPTWIRWPGTPGSGKSEGGAR